MFENTGAVFSFSVDDVVEAQEFYEQKLGLRTTLESGDEDYAVLWLHLSGGSSVLIYPKLDHIPATFTLLNFVVEDIDDVVDQLTSRGVRFLRYDQFGADDKGIVRGEDRDMAWFSDPAGNNHSVARPKTPSSSLSSAVGGGPHGG